MPVPALKHIHYSPEAIKDAQARADRDGAKIIRFDVLAGFYLERKRGGWVWAVERNVDGKVRRERLDPYREHEDLDRVRYVAMDAMARLGQADFKPARVRAAESRVADRLAGLTIHGAADWYAETYPAIRENTILLYRHHARRLFPEDIRLAEITRADVRDAFNAVLGDGLATTTCDAMVRSGKALWNGWAQAHPEDAEPTGNPFASFKRRGRARSAPVRRLNSLDPAERLPWFSEAVARGEFMGRTGTAHRALAILFLTGLRRDEVLDLSWAEVDLDGGYLHIGGARMKSGQPLSRPITDRVVELLDRQRVWSNSDGAKGYVFPSRKRPDKPFAEIRKTLARINEAACGRADRITPHDLRRTYIAAANIEGIPPVALKMLVGHSISDVTEGYAVIQSQLPKIARRLEDALLAPQEGDESDGR